MSNALPNLVADRYRLIEPLGQGGMGRVWKARDEVLHRDVAIKELVPPPGLTDDERREMRERSLREARAIARLNHTNVVRVFDVLRTDGDPWIVMEYVPSRSLHDVLTKDGPVSVTRAAEIGLGMLGALKAAHRAGVMHRDVKPGNVLLGDDGRVVLTDFGLATIPGDPTVTRTGLVMGSPAYIAPERAKDGTAGPHADLWSLGATLYAAVEGQSPYARQSAIETLTALATEPPPPPKNAGPLKGVLAGLLRKDPTQRMTADEAERSLRRVLHKRQRGISLLDGVRRPGHGSREDRTRATTLPAPRPARELSDGAAAAAAAAGAAAAVGKAQAPGGTAPAGPSARTATDRSGPGNSGSDSGTSTARADSPPAPRQPSSGTSAGAGARAAGAGAAAAGAGIAASGGAAGTAAPAAGAAGTPAAGAAGAAAAPTAGNAVTGAAGASAPAGETARGGVSGVDGVASGPAGGRPSGRSTSATRADSPTEADDSAAAAVADGTAGAPDDDVDDGFATDGRKRNSALAAGAAVAGAAAAGAAATKDRPGGGKGNPSAPAYRRGTASVGATGSPANPTEATRVDEMPPARGRSPISVPPAVGSGNRKKWLIAALAAAVLLALVVILPLARRDLGSGSGTPNAGSTTGAASAPPAGTPSAEPSTAAPTSAAPTQPSTTPSGLVLPAGWHIYSDPTGFKVPVPESWTVSREKIGDGPEDYRVYFRDPNSPRMLLVDQTTHPLPDPVADWKDKEAARRRSVVNYQRVGEIHAVPFWKKCADWEWLQGSDSQRVHVRNRGFVTARDKAYALRWDAPAADWDRYLPEFDNIVAKGFVPVRHD